MNVSNIKDFRKKIPAESIWKGLVFSTIAIMLAAPALGVGMLTQQASGASCTALPASAVVAIGNEVGNVPANVIDGSFGTRWSNEGKGSWINIDLGTSANVCYVDIAWYKGDTRQNTFTISHSADTKSYTQVYSGKSSGNTALFERYDFSDVLTRHVRITVNGNTESNWASITEVKVYGYVSGVLDKTKPSVTIDEPAHKSVIMTSSSSATVTVKGKASDLGSGIQLVEVRTQKIGYQAATPVAPGDWAAWSYSLKLPIGTHDITARATDKSGNSNWYTMSVTVSAVPVQSPPAPEPTPTPNPDGSSNIDRFGVAMIYPTIQDGRQWDSKWDNGVARTFGNSQNDPYDPLFKTSKNGGGFGDGSYKTSGDGVLKISGKYPRMYVLDDRADWTNVEITVYGMRVADTNIAWAGIQAYARTNHGAIGDEDTNSCDTRGYGAQLTYPGKFLFEKETSHHEDNGYAQVGQKTVWSSGMPKNTWIGYKFVVRDIDGGKHVKLETYMDTTGGKNGGTWVKVGEFTDTGSNFGTNNASCKSGISAGLPLTSSNDRPGSETGRPNVAVYFRSDGVSTDGLQYKWASIREVAPLP